MSIESLRDEWLATAEEIGVAPQHRETVEQTLDKLAAHHPATADHSRRVGILAVKIGRALDLPLKPLFYAGSLHDRGKLNVDAKLLDKTDLWTEEDAARLRAHPMDGYEATLEDGMIITAGLVARHHHFQEANYPDQLPEYPVFAEDIIKSCSRMLALADYYDAAHRKNSSGVSTGEEIKAKLLAHNQELSETIEMLYQVGVFAINA